MDREEGRQLVRDWAMAVEAEYGSGSGLAALDEANEVIAALETPFNATLDQIRALCVSRSGDRIGADPIWPDELLAILDGWPVV